MDATKTGPDPVQEADDELSRRLRKRTLFRVEAAVLVATALIAFAILVIEDGHLQRLLGGLGLILSAVGGLCAIELVRGRHDRIFGGMLASAWIGSMILFVLMLTAA